MQQQPPFIEVKNITKRFGKKLVLNNISLHIPYGKIFGLIGENGSGKTTLLKILIGFHEPEKGKILFQLREIADDARNIKKIFGFAAQENCFYNKLTVKENVVYFGKLYDLPSFIIKENAGRIIKLVGLYDHKDYLAEHLSFGMQRRLDIACALIHDPQVLILDEPTEELDPLLRKDMVSLIKKINKQGTTIIITSHLLEEVEEVCDEIAILGNTNVIATGSVDELKKRYSKKSQIIIQTLSGRYKEIIERLRKEKIKDIEKKGKKLIVYSDKVERTLYKILHVIENSEEELEDVEINKPSLEEIFESIMKQNG